jgi:Big-like domain-containing protein
MNIPAFKALRGRAIPQSSIVGLLLNEAEAKDLKGTLTVSPWTIPEGGAATVSLAALLAPSTVEVSASPNAAYVAQKVTLTAQVSSVAALTGTVTFFDGAKPLGSPIAVSAGAPIYYTTKTLAVGTHSITAVYSGNQNVLGATSAILKEIIDAASGTSTIVIP